MNKFPAKYTQLPNFEHEYLEIINKITEGMPKSEVEDIIGTIKGSVIKNKYKHRTHLENLGLFKTGEDNLIYFSKVLMDIKEKKFPLKEGLLILIETNFELVNIFKVIDGTGYFDKKISKKQLSIILNSKYFQRTPANTIDRYLNQILNLYEIVGVEKIRQSIKDNEAEAKKSNFTVDSFLEELEKFYLKSIGDYGKVLAIEKINNHFVENYSIPNDKILKILEHIYLSDEFKFKYTFTMLPIWSTKSKVFKIKDTLFTHLIIEFR